MWVYPEIASMADLTRYHARVRGDALALWFGQNKISWRDFDRRASRIANAFIARGASSSGAVAFYGKNSNTFLELMFGSFKADVPFLPLNWRLTAHELAAILADSDPSTIFIERAFSETLAKALGMAGLAPPEIVQFDPIAGQFAELDQFVDSANGDDPMLTIPLHHTALRLYTSGTTGQPKGVELSHGSFMHMRLCEHFEPALRWDAEDVYLFVLPNYHLAGIGICLQSLYNGGAVAILPEFQPAAVLRAIRDTRPSITMLVPATIQMLLDHPDAASTDFSCFRLVMYAGSPISLGLIKRAIAEMKCEFMQFYGATETSGAATLLRPNEHDFNNEQNLKSCGTPLPLIEIRIVDPSGHEVADGETGEFLIRAPSIFKEYFNKPADTKAAKVNGWYRSGDAGYKAKNGLYFIVDRIKDMIVSGGANIYSTEVENVLSKHPSVAHSAVIGIPDDKWGEAVKALVVLKKGATVNSAELVVFCREYIAGYKVPKSIDFVEALPMTPTGKVLKRELRRQHAR
jgi:acyl-CoA synthetase (AMP-forming)/AMP-acid ligase II